MFLVAKSAVHKFIEYLMNRTKGVSIEEKLVSLLKTLLLILSFSLWLNLMAVSNNIWLRLDNKDLESSIAELSDVFKKESNPLDEFININKRQSENIDSLKKSNDALYHDNMALVGRLKVLNSIGVCKIEIDKLNAVSKK